MDVSIIIVNYNTRQLLADCLQSVFLKTTGVSFEVLVSDNGSTDGSVEMLKRNYPQVILIENKANLGFGKANNVAAKIAKGKYLFFLNSDTLLLNNALKEFFDFAESYQKDCLLGTWLVNKNGETIQSYGCFTSFYKKLFQYIYEFFPFLLKIRLSLFPIKKTEGINKCLNVDFVTGADLFIRASCFKSLNGFDEVFFMYYEDEDLAYRADLMGCKSFLISSPRIVHLVGKSSKVSARKIKIMETSFLYYIKKHSTNRQFLLNINVYKIFMLIRFFSPVLTLKEKLQLYRNSKILIKNLV